MESQSLALSIDIDDCSEHSCANGATCVDGINNFSCKCMVGFTGERCEIGKIRLRLGLSVGCPLSILPVFSALILHFRRCLWSLSICASQLSATIVNIVYRLRFFIWMT